MRRTKRSGSWFLCLLINLVLNLEWSIPAWIMLLLHRYIGLSIRWFIGGVLLWILSILVGMWIMGWAAESGSVKDPPKENKNPYSAKKHP